MTALEGWRRLDYSPPEALAGRHARLERLSVAAHAAALHASNPTDAAHWAYMSSGPFATAEAYREWATAAAAGSDPAFYAVAGADGWRGVASLLRIDRDNGVLEIGHIAFSPGLQRTPASTEAIHLLIAQAFDAGFRRVEWKCNARNAPSRRAADRLGFAFEGVFRQHMVVRGANRDTAWYAIVDGDWPAVRAAHLRWLAPSNFDADGSQRQALAASGASGARGAG